MDNQHRKLEGYGELTQADIDAMNEASAIGLQLRLFIDGLKVNPHLSRHPDPRWLATATTDLQKGFMALKRSIAQPTGF